MSKAGDMFGMIAVSTKLPDNVGMSLDGTKEITDLFSANDVFNKDSINTEGIMGKAREIWGWSTSFLQSVPWWGYAIGGAIILWYMPAKFLFGVFPI